MELEPIYRFLFWCCILNGILLAFWSIFILGFKSFICKLEGFFMKIPHEKIYTLNLYFIIGYKILYIFFNIVPFIVVSLIKNNSFL